MNSPLSYYVAAGAIYGGLSVIVVQSMADVARGMWRRWTRPQKRVDKRNQITAIRWREDRLRYRRQIVGYSYADLKGDKPYVAPSERVDTEQLVADTRKTLAERDSELTAFLQSTAQRLSRERGRITTDDIWEVVDENPRMQAKLNASPKTMTVAWYPADLWAQTGRYVKSRRKLNHGRPVAEWVLRSMVDARPALKVVGAE